MIKATSVISEENADEIVEINVDFEGELVVLLTEATAIVDELISLVNEKTEFEEPFDIQAFANVYKVAKESQVDRNILESEEKDA